MKRKKFVVRNVFNNNDENETKSMHDKIPRNMNHVTSKILPIYIPDIEHDYVQNHIFNVKIHFTLHIEDAILYRANIYNDIYNKRKFVEGPLKCFSYGRENIVYFDLSFPNPITDVFPYYINDTIAMEFWRNMFGDYKFSRWKYYEMEIFRTRIAHLTSMELELMSRLQRPSLFKIGDFLDDLPSVRDDIMEFRSFKHYMTDNPKHDFYCEKVYDIHNHFFKDGYYFIKEYNDISDRYIVIHKEQHRNYLEKLYEIFIDNHGSLFKSMNTRNIEILCNCHDDIHHCAIRRHTISDVYSKLDFYMDILK